MWQSSGLFRRLVKNLLKEEVDVTRLLRCDYERGRGRFGMVCCPCDADAFTHVCYKGGCRLPVDRNSQTLLNASPRGVSSREGGERGVGTRWCSNSAFCAVTAKPSVLPADAREGGREPTCCVTAMKTTRGRVNERLCKVT